MAYDEGLAHRIREMLEARRGGSEKRMFGGLCFLQDGHMVAGIVGSELMVRVGADAYAEALAHPDAREMDFTGRAMRGFVYVGEQGIAEDEDLCGWLERGLRHAERLPPKGARQHAKRSAAKKKRAAPKKTAAKKKPAAKKKRRAAPKKRAAKKKPSAKKRRAIEKTRAARDRG